MTKRLALILAVALTAGTFGTILAAQPASAYAQCPHGAYTIARWRGGNVPGQSDVFKTSNYQTWDTYGNATTCWGDGVINGTSGATSGCWTNGALQGGGHIKSCNMWTGYCCLPSQYRSYLEGYYDNQPWGLVPTHYDYPEVWSDTYNGPGAALRCEWYGSQTANMSTFICDTFQWA